jgi:uncharacterized protein YbjT (DUF2867 family)
MTILVTGATGKVGRQVLAQLRDRGVEVRALVRNPPTARLPDGVEVVRGDLTDVDSVKAALKGVDTVFLVWPFFHTHGLGPVVEAIADQATRIVYLSSEGADDSDSVKWTKDVELAIEQTSLEWTFLRPCGFAGNALSFAQEIKRGDVVRAPFAKMARPLIHEYDMAAVGVRALLGDGHAGAKYSLTGPELVTQVEQIQIIGAALGRPLRFEEISPETARAEMLASGWPEQFVDGALAGWAQMMDEPEPITSTVEEITGSRARTFEEWVGDNVAAFRTP